MGGLDGNTATADELFTINSKMSELCNQHNKHKLLGLTPMKRVNYLLEELGIE